MSSKGSPVIVVDQESGFKVSVPQTSCNISEAIIAAEMKVMMVRTHLVMRPMCCKILLFRLYGFSLDRVITVKLEVFPPGGSLESID